MKTKDKEQKKVMFHARITWEQYNTIRNEAKKLKKSESEVIRLWIDERGGK